MSSPAGLSEEMRPIVLFVADMNERLTFFISAILLRFYSPSIVWSTYLMKT